MPSTTQEGCSRTPVAKDFSGKRLGVASHLFQKSSTEFISISSSWASTLQWTLGWIWGCDNKDKEWLKSGGRDRTESQCEMMTDWDPLQEVWSRGQSQHLRNGCFKLSPPTLIVWPIPLRLQRLNVLFISNWFWVLFFMLIVDLDFWYCCPRFQFYSAEGLKHTHFLKKN